MRKKLNRQLLAIFCRLNILVPLLTQDFHSSGPHVQRRGGVELSAIILFQLSGRGEGRGGWSVRSWERWKCEKISISANHHPLVRVDVSIFGNTPDID